MYLLQGPLITNLRIDLKEWIRISKDYAGIWSCATPTAFNYCYAKSNAQPIK